MICSEWWHHAFNLCAEADGCLFMSLLFTPRPTDAPTHAKHETPPGICVDWDVLFPGLGPRNPRINRDPPHPPAHPHTHTHLAPDVVGARAHVNNIRWNRWIGFLELPHVRKFLNARIVRVMKFRKNSVAPSRTSVELNSPWRDCH